MAVRNNGGASHENGSIETRPGTPSCLPSRHCFCVVIATFASLEQHQFAALVARVNARVAKAWWWNEPVWRRYRCCTGMDERETRGLVRSPGICTAAGQ